MLFLLASGMMKRASTSMINDNATKLICPLFMSRQLSRLLQSIHLPSLRQGGTLSIRSSLPQKLRVKVVSEWRADGHVALAQTKTSIPVAHASVVKEKDTRTALGRVEPHISVHVAPKNDDEPGLKSFSKVESDGTAELMDDEARHDVGGSEKDFLTRPDTESSPQEHVTLTALVPEKVNLKCDLPNGGSIALGNKIEGDVHLSTADGDITVSKARGYDVNLTASGPDNIIFASNVLEAKNLCISTVGRIRVKRILGEKVKIDAMRNEAPQNQPGVAFRKMDEDDQGSIVDISSLYVSGSGYSNLDITSSQETMSNQSAVRVKSSHGHISVVAKVLGSVDDRTPVVVLDGVNGSCDVSVHVKEAQPGEVCTAGTVHFDRIAAGSVNEVTAGRGDISISFDRSVETDLRLASSPFILAIDPRATMVEADCPDEVSGLLCQLQASQNADSRPLPATTAKISTPADSFFRNPQLCIDNNESDGLLEYIDGWVETKDQGPDSGTGGKIRIDDAAAQALQGFTDSPPSKGTTEEEDRPLLIAATSGSITIDILSWVECIARRHGLPGYSGSQS